MKTSAVAFLERLIDYAGLFPPASLELEEAARNYLDYRRQDTSWMLNRMICPAGRTPELNSLLTEWDAPAVSLSVTARPAPGADEFLHRLDSDLEVFSNVPDDGSRITLDAVEAPIPTALLESLDQTALGEFFASVQAILRRRGRTAAELFFEAAVERDRTRVWDAVARAVAAYNHSRREDLPEVGFKLRCGGVAPQAFPSTDDLAAILDRARTGPVKLKATAGLHHPIRQFDSAIGVWMHGFLNLFGAGILAHSAGLSEERLRQMLEDADPENFRFEEDRFTWREHHCLTARIREIRSRYLTSLGSCSFDEPRQDLASLGLLPHFQLT